MSHDEISEFMGVDAKPVTQITIPKKIDIGTTSQEYAEAAKNVKNVAEVGEMALYELANLAAQTEDPKIYSILAALMKEVVSANEKLLHLKKTKLEIEIKELKEETPDKVITNNNLFVGSTSDLLKQLKDSNNDTT